MPKGVADKIRPNALGQYIPLPHNTHTHTHTFFNTSYDFMTSSIHRYCNVLIFQLIEPAVYFRKPVSDHASR